MTSINICNLALSYLGNTRAIQSKTEQSTESILCNRFYDITRESLLEVYPWNFAVKEIDLILAQNETNNGFAYVYEYPDDCLRVLKIMSANDSNVIVNDYNVVYAHDAVDVKRIVCDVADAKASYIVDIQDVDAMPKSFRKALALALAEELAVPLSSSAQLAQVIQQKASIALDTAKRMSALERNQPLVKTNRYLDARR